MANLRTEVKRKAKQLARAAVEQADPIAYLDQRYDGLRSIEPVLDPIYIVAMALARRWSADAKALTDDFFGASCGRPTK